MAYHSPEIGTTPPYSTIELAEHHYLGNNRLPATHTTQRLIEASEPLSHVSYTISPYAVRVEPTEGADSAIIQEMGNGLSIVTLGLGEQLFPGHQLHLAYDVDFDYPENVAPPTIFRRAIGSQALRKLQILVAFDGLGSAPDSISWVEWYGRERDGRLLPVSEEAVEPAPMNDEPNPPQEAYRELADVRRKIVGFQWRW